MKCFPFAIHFRIIVFFFLSSSSFFLIVICVNGNSEIERIQFAVRSTKRKQIQQRSNYLSSTESNSIFKLLYLKKKTFLQFQTRIYENSRKMHDLQADEKSTLCCNWFFQWLELIFSWLLFIFIFIVNLVLKLLGVEKQRIAFDTFANVKK